MKIEQLRIYFSNKRLGTYEKIAQQKGLGVESVAELYKLNILICEELYAFLGGIEVCLRNRIHNKMIEITSQENWFDNVKWLERHANSLNEAKIPKYNGEPKPSADDVISRLGFGFWCHIFDASYENILWTPALRMIFPYYTSRPKRKDIAIAFKSLLKIRNRIAHFEPIIKDEVELLRIYKQMVEIMNWMCPDIYLWFETFNKFKDLYKKLTTNSFK